jgi:Arm DNA-binding domain
MYQRGGFLQFDFRYKGQRCRDSSSLTDNAANRRRCDMAMKRIEAEIVLGTFDYAAYFPDGGKVELFRSLEKRIASAKSDTPLFRNFAETWFAERRIECSGRPASPTYIEAPMRHVDPADRLDLLARIDTVALRGKLKPVSIGSVIEIVKALKRQRASNDDNEHARQSRLARLQTALIDAYRSV